MHQQAGTLEGKLLKSCAVSVARKSGLRTTSSDTRYCSISNIAAGRFGLKYRRRVGPLVSSKSIQTSGPRSDVGARGFRKFSGKKPLQNPWVKPDRPAVYFAETWVKSSDWWPRKNQNACPAFCQARAEPVRGFACI